MAGVITMSKAGSADDSEWRTRKRLIDPRLQAAGWKVGHFDAFRRLDRRVPRAVEEFPTANGPADYALVVDGQVLGVLEAKKLTLGPQNALTQAERYSRGVSASPFNFHGFRVPFLYSTNGEVLWHHDVRHPQSRSRRIAHFHTPDALREMLATSEDPRADARDARRTTQRAIGSPAFMAPYVPHLTSRRPVGGAGPGVGPTPGETG